MCIRDRARGGQITARSDLYSLGIVFYEMLTGKLPFDGESSVAVAIKHLQEMPLPPTSLKGSLPVALDQILNRALAKNPVSYTHLDVYKRQGNR